MRGDSLFLLQLDDEFAIGFVETDIGEDGLVPRIFKVRTCAGAGGEITDVLQDIGVPDGVAVERDGPPLAVFFSHALGDDEQLHAGSVSERVSGSEDIRPWPTHSLGGAAGEISQREDSNIPLRVFLLYQGCKGKVVLNGLIHGNPYRVLWAHAQPIQEPAKHRSSDDVDQRFGEAITFLLKARADASDGDDNVESILGLLIDEVGHEPGCTQRRAFHSVRRNAQHQFVDMLQLHFQRPDEYEIDH